MINQFNTSLWGDEAFSAVLSMNSLPKIIEIITRDTSPPLYNIILHFWYQLFGTGEASIRSLSFLFFILAVFFTYNIGSLLFGRKTGCLAAVLTFFNPFFFIYAFEGRMYSILALGVTSSMYFFLRILYNSQGVEKKRIKNPIRTPFWLISAYSLSTAWALYSHHFSIFAVFVQFLWFIFEFFFGRREPAKSIFKGLLLAGLLYLPWLYPLYKQTTMVAGGFWLGIPTLTDLRNLIYTYLAEGIKGHIVTVPVINKELHQIALFFVFAILIFRRWHKNIKKTIILLFWFTIPIFATWFISQKMQSIFFDRYLLYTIPAGMLLLASNNRKFSGILIGSLLILLGIIDYNYFIHPNKRPFREMANYVEQTQKTGDFLINWNSKAHHLWESKYYKIPAPIYVPQGSLPYYVGTAQMTEKDVIKEIPDAQRIGIITSGSIEEISIPHYTEISSKSFGELKFVWLIKKN